MSTRRRLAAACLLIVVTLLGSTPVTDAAPCGVASSDPTVAAARVRALGDEGDATAAAVVSFIGGRGQPIATAASLELPVVDRVPLAGVVAPAAPPSRPSNRGQEIVAREAKPSGKEPKQKHEPEAELKSEPKRESETKAKTESAPRRVDP